MEKATAETIGQKIIREMEEVNSYNQKICKCLNELENIIIPHKEDRNPLIVDEENYNILDELILIKFDILKNLDINNYEYIFLIKFFEFAFIKESALNYELINDKVEFLQLIFNELGHEKISDESEKYKNDILENHKEWIPLENIISELLNVIGLIFCGYIKFSKTNKDVVEFLLDVLKLFYDVNAKFDWKNLEIIPKGNISESFIKLLSDELENFIVLVIENNMIVMKRMDPEEIVNAISQGKKLIKKKINKNKFPKNYKKEDNMTEIKSIEIRTGKPSEKEKLKNIETIKINNSNKNNDITNINNINLNQTQNLNLKEEQKKKDDEELEKIGKNEVKKDLNYPSIESGKENNLGNEEYQSLKKTLLNLQRQIDSLNEKNIRLESDKKIIENKYEKIYKLANENKVEIKKLRNELDLIKVRGGLKAFIDYIYYSFNLKDSIYYEDKITELYKYLEPLIFNVNYDNELIQQLKILLSNSLKKLKIDNDYAHPFLDDSAIKIIFNIADPNNECQKLKSKLIEKKIDTPILKLIEIRKMNFYKKEKLEQEEKTLTDEFRKNDLKKLLFRKS